MVRKLFLLTLILGAIAPAAAASIKLVSNDDQEFEIEKAAAEQSETIKNMLADLEDQQDQPINLPAIDGKTLGLIVEFLQKKDIEVKKLDLEALINLVNAANGLDIPKLLDAAATVLAEHIQTNKAKINIQELKEKLPLDMQKLVEAKMPFKLLQTLTGHTDSVFSVAWSPDGTKLASGSWDKTIKIWNAQTGTELQTLTGHTGFVHSVAWSPDGTKLASGSYDKTIKIWDAQTGTELQTLTGHTTYIQSVAWSPDGTKLASGSYDKTIKIWDAQTGTELQTLTGHTDWVISVAWSPDGTKLASAADDNTIKIWDAQTGTELQTLTGHSNSVHSVVWSPDGTKLASAADDNTIKIWDAQTGTELQTLTGHSNSVHSVVWSPDGTKLASGSWELKIWNAQTGTELQTLTGHRSRIWSVVWSPDGTKLASGSYDKTIKIWKRESIFSHDENNEKSEKTEPSGQLVTAEPTDWLFYTGALAGLCFIGYKLFFNK